MKVNRINDMDWGEICKKYNLDIHYDTLRKAQQTIFGGAFVYDYFNSKCIFNKNGAYSEDLAVQKQELYKEKIKLQDERKELNKRLRDEARLETKFELLENLIKNTVSKDFVPSPPTPFKGYNDLLVCLSDLHIGASYSSAFGKYNSEIAKQRLEQYLGEIIQTQKIYQSEKCHIALLGDMISGNIHKSISISNRENVMEQIKICCDYIYQFVKQLSPCFNEIVISSVNGNHTRIDRKEDAVKDERMDALIPWYLETKLSKLSNVKVACKQLDSTVSLIEIRGLKYALVHGDYDSFSKTGAGNLTLMLGNKPYALVFGHYHTCAFDDANGIKLIRSGCLGGSGDDYTIEKRLSGKPSQMVCVCSEKGIKSYLPIELE